jgi:hypothetical protein
MWKTDPWLRVRALDGCDGLENLRQLCGERVVKSDSERPSPGRTAMEATLPSSGARRYVRGSMATTKRRGPGRPRKTTNAFGRWIDESRYSRDQIAERLGMSRSYLDQLCAGIRRPNLELAFKIEDMSKGAVPARSWLKASRHTADSD